MLNRIDITHFKCFENLKLPLGPLTLLSGSNASGKSTILQCLVLLHQTMQEHEWSTRLMLNGGSIQLGTVSDVVDKVHGRRTWEVGITENNLSCQWIFEGERAEMSMNVKRVSVNGSVYEGQEALRFLLPPTLNDDAASLAARLRSLTYITAERVGPREVYSLEDRQVASVVGPSGEHAVSLLHWGRDQQVLPRLLLSNAPATRLRQVEERMATFFPGFGMDVQPVPQTNAVTLGIRTSSGTDFHRPIHVGFGLTQIFPIVVAAISAKEGDILLIENPEVHLHPAGQAKMGQFLAEIAQAGVQVIVESHSDHILNGIRRSVRAKVLTPDQIAIHFFIRPSSEGPQVVSPQIDVTGNIDHWPEGFFDQFDKDASHFAGWEK